MMGDGMSITRSGQSSMPNCDLLIVIPAAGVGADPHTGDAQPEHATGGWGVVIHPPTTLVSRAGQVCVPFKI